jgi:hypothetical protein
MSQKRERGEFVGPLISHNENPLSPVPDARLLIYILTGIAPDDTAWKAARIPLIVCGQICLLMSHRKALPFYEPSQSLVLETR